MDAFKCRMCETCMQLKNKLAIVTLVRKLFDRLESQFGLSAITDELFNTFARSSPLRDLLRERRSSEIEFL